MGRKTEKWNKVRAKLKKEFEAQGIVRCELCGGTFALGFAHSKKRRFIYTDDDWEEVALLCQPCHEKVEHSGHDNMYVSIRGIIENRMDRVWDRGQVRELTLEQEREVGDILTKLGTTLHLNPDEYDRIDGYTKRGDEVTALVEIKSRSDAWSRYVNYGSFLVDASKILHLQRQAKEAELKAILIVYTSDKVLAWVELKGEYDIHERYCRKNHHSREMVKKEVILIPIEDFNPVFPEI